MIRGYYYEERKKDIDKLIHFLLSLERLRLRFNRDLDILLVFIILNSAIFFLYFLISSSIFFKFLILY